MSQRVGLYLMTGAWIVVGLLWVTVVLALTDYPHGLLRRLGLPPQGGRQAVGIAILGIASLLGWTLWGARIYAAWTR